MSSAELPSWDLSDLYKSQDDPQLNQDIELSLHLADKFAAKWTGKIIDSGLTSEELSCALKEYIELNELIYRYHSYASLAFAKNTSEHSIAALLQKASEIASSISTKVLFFDLELGKISQEVWDRIKNAPILKEFVHYVSYQRKIAHYCLSEAEEKIFEEKSNSSSRAFERLFTETVSRLKFPYKSPNNEEKILTQSELLALSYDPDRTVRSNAAKVLSKVLTENSHPLHFAYSTLILDKITEDRIRGFVRPEQSRNVDNELADTVVDVMIETVRDNYGIVSDYYKLKKELLGLDTLYHYDRYAPFTSEMEKVPFEKAKEIVLESFEEFSPKLKEMVVPFFEKHWIDASLEESKRGGAFCAGIIPSIHPYVLLNYTGKSRDVMTLAHELGHAVHDLFASKQNLLNYHPVLPLAETASTFAELLCFERMQKDLKSPQDKLNLLCQKLEDIFATVFRQGAMYTFEQRVFNKRMEQGELSIEDMSSLWQESIQEMFGDSLTLGEDHKATWLYIPHFIHTPFYVYAYSFGELLVLCLYACYKKQGEAFKNKYFELLSSGGCQSPAELLKPLDIDISSKEFWQSGCDLIRQQVQAAKDLVDEVNKEKYPDKDWEDGKWDDNSGWGDGDSDGWDGSQEENLDKWDL